MLDKLIEADEESEKSEDNNIIKFREDISDSEDEKLFGKEFFINPSFQNEDNNKIHSSKNVIITNLQPIISRNESNSFNNNIFNVNKNVYNNFNCFFFFYYFIFFFLF